MAFVVGVRRLTMMSLPAEERLVLLKFFGDLSVILNICHINFKFQISNFKFGDEFEI